jgi:outer membrane protein OmpA-like peptidoglycan-associated protein
MNRIIKGFINNRGLLQNIRIGILFFTFSMLCIQVNGQITESNISKMNENIDVEKLLSYSELDINAVYGADDLRILGEVFLTNYYYEKAEICYQKLLREFDTSALAEDYMNYYYCLLNLRKQDVILKLNNHKFDSNQWVSLLKSAARVQNYFFNEEIFESSVLNSNISSLNGFTVTNDTIHYFLAQLSGKAVLAETSEILSHRLGMAKLKFALLSNDSIMNVSGFERAFNSKLLKYIARQVFVLQNSKDIFYSVEFLKSGRQSILVASDWITPFSFNSDEYDCAMPFFDEKSQILYFCSNMAGGYGGLDIYSSMLRDGKWLQPVNLGDKINTPFADLYPIISSCGLLFSSNGRAGMGGLDNYLYSLHDRISYNLYQYNSTGDDFGLQEIQNTCMGFANENMMNYNSLLSDAFTQIKKDEKGLFAFLQPEKFKAANSNRFVIADSIKKLNDDLKSVNLRIENLIQNGNIYFGYSLSVIEDSQLSILDSVCEAILRLNIKQVYVFGYTDVSGSVSSNNSLAYRRAVSVINYFKAKNATPDKVNFTPVAMGEIQSQSKQINPKERKIRFLIAEEIPNEIGFVLVEDPISGSLGYLSVRKLHLVLQGETLYNLSLQYDCPLEWIRQINSLDNNNNNIIKDEYIFIPESIKTSHN